MKYILVLLLMLVGCGKVNTYNTPFIEDGYDSIVFKGQQEMCDDKTDSIFCVNSESIGDIMPTVPYAHSIVEGLRKNTKYKVSDDWHYTNTVHEYQVRDCEDEAMTMIKHMVDGGIDKKYLYMVYRLTSKTTAHMFVGIMTNKGLMHMDLNTGVRPIEDKINFYMPMTNVGVNSWIKGNIR